jgi:hypothetical protein
MVLETVVYPPFDHMTRLLARKHFIEFFVHFSLRSSSDTYFIPSVIDIFRLKCAEIRLLVLPCLSVCLHVTIRERLNEFSFLILQVVPNLLSAVSLVTVEQRQWTYYVSLSQIFFHGGAFKTIFHVLRNPSL